MTLATNATPRLDVWLAEHRDITRHAARTLIDAGAVQVNGRPGRPGQRIRGTDDVAVTAVERVHRPMPVQPEAALSVTYEDDQLAVIDKPAGMVVHPAPGHATGTLAQALLARGTTWSTLGGAERPGIVHRLDRDTSGLLVVAKTELSHRRLAAQLRDRTLGRSYIAIVRGQVRERSGTIDAPVGRDPRQRKRMAVVDGGREAVTDFVVRRRGRDVSELEVSLRTGRTHQIRVHLAYIRHPVVGDTVYGTPDERLGRLALHACRLHLQHPMTGERCEFVSAPPPAFDRYLADMRAS